MLRDQWRLDDLDKESRNQRIFARILVVVPTNIQECRSNDERPGYENRFAGGRAALRLS
jgi:hypothetical protein